MDLETLSLPEMVRLQAQIGDVLRRRFERALALCFTDVVGSTAYFARHGDVAGRALQQRHLDLLGAQLATHGGRIVDTAGDGAFSCFSSLPEAATALSALMVAAEAEGASLPEAHRLSLRAGLHWGRVLSDGTVVWGDAVNLCARVAGTAQPTEIVLSGDAFRELPPALRLRCTARAAERLKGIAEPVELWTLGWRSAHRPVAILVKETGARLVLPSKNVISFGRLATHDGRPANDVVLKGADAQATRLVSRWHFELEASGDHWVLRTLGDQGTHVDGQAVPRDGRAVVRTGTVVDVAGALTLTFVGGERAEDFEQPTLEGRGR